MKASIPFLAGFVILTSACGGIPPGTHGVVVVGNPGTTSSDLRIEELLVDGMKLQVRLNHGGGCGEHGFEMRWNGAFRLDQAIDSAMLVLAHDAHGDRCEAYLTRTVEFDLTPIRDAWRKQSGTSNGTVRLGIEGTQLTALMSF